MISKAIREMRMALLELGDIDFGYPLDENVVLDAKWPKGLPPAFGKIAGSQWMNEFYHSASGESAEEWLDGPKGRRSKLPWPAMKVLFPSLKTVRESIGGEPVRPVLFTMSNVFSLDVFD